MSTEPFTHTLQQLQVRFNHDSNLIGSLNFKDGFLRMEVLHTFSFIKSCSCHLIIEWILVNVLTSFRLMAILRPINFSLVIDVDDLSQMSNSALFTDSRHIHIHYALIINDDRLDIAIINNVPHGSQSHSRQIASATFISYCWTDNQPFITPDVTYVSSNLINIRDYCNDRQY
ncbi:unnamed protein product [Rotaria socialis]|uniref:Uncharacterized protein n=1 Tax=Rotaria socialis TaxID=392032 RepID=A0A818I0U8_9BILA|nr:unnamed protein product [Rotaria socialis]CAF3517228.1 unnamed protein product [Rotaria socialis]CAF3583044.1 unnamed protein product [Rotaria socialis]CAF3634415.1 unnamed protein product [Rotaria socialis]CAF3699429.1 unnamed protein product [Rotaria socialis]